MTSLIEFQRVKLQEELDTAKTQTDRNKLGQFATPTLLAADIVKYAKSILPSRSKIRFLDPAFGTGSFYSALLGEFRLSRIVKVTGYEIDPHYGDKALRLWNHTPLKLELADFTMAVPPESTDAKANLLICNPPYVRHHHLSSEQKIYLQKRAEQITGVRLSGLAGLYCYFIILSHAWLTRNALAGWLVPSEFMDVDYGKQVKRYLTQDVTLVRVHRFDSEDTQFSDALVSSAVVWYRKATPRPNHTVEFSYGGSLLEPRSSNRIPLATLRTTDKWSKARLVSNIAPLAKRLKLSDLFKVKRGLATGANNFFILTPEQASQHQIPKRFLVPILPSPRYLPSNEIDADANGNPILDRRLFLLTCDLPEDEVKARYPFLWKYLQAGVELGLDKRYLCNSRSPWYSQENRPAAKLLCTYMGRQDVSDGRPFKFVLNHSKATAANVYLMLYPKPVLEKLLKDDPTLVRSIWEILNQVSSETIINEGRTYGGGLHKVEPKELGNIPANALLDILPGLSR